MKRKNIKLAVNVFLGKKCFQVALTPKEQEWVFSVIEYAHGDKIKLLKEELPLKLK